MSLGGLRQMSGDRKIHSRTLQVKNRLAEKNELLRQALTRSREAAGNTQSDSTLF